MEKLFIGHHVVPIHGTDQKTLDAFLAQEEMDDGSPMGCYRCRDAEIFILATLKDSMKASVLMHEVVECLNDLYDFGFEHARLTRISEILTDVLVNNPTFFIKFLKEFGADVRQEKEKRKEENPPRKLHESQGKQVLQHVGGSCGTCECKEDGEK